MIKAAFFDVDGTLLPQGAEYVPDSAIRSLKKLREQGVKVFLSTGRPMCGLESVSVIEIPVDGYISINGQLVMDAQRNILYREPFPRPVVEELIALFWDKETPALLIGEKGLYCNFSFANEYYVQVITSAELRKILDEGMPIYQATVYVGREQDAALERQLPKECKLARWSDGGVDVIAANGGKVTGIRQILTHLGISQEEIIAFGDAENDMDMLEFAKIGIAMGNASHKVKAVADYVTAHINDDGIEKALKHLGLI